MQIREVYIDGFGVFSDLQVTGFASGINVVFGENEFGKSTLLEFIRRVLFGFPRSSASINPYPPLRGGAYGGRLVCECDDGTMVTIARAPGPHGGRVVVSRDDRRSMGQDALDHLLHNLTRTFYENVYAISLDELQEVRSLQSDEVKALIYGAGLGLGGVSLAVIKGEIRGCADVLYKQRGSAQKIPELYTEIQALERQRRTIQEGLAHFDEYSEARARLIKQEEGIAQQIEGLQSEHRSLENRVRLYPQYLRIREAEEELTRIEEVREIPEEAIAAIRELRKECVDLDRRINEEHRAELSELQKMAHELTFSEELLKEEATVNELQGLAGKYRSVCDDIGTARRDREDLTGVIAAGLERLGEGWTEEKARAFVLAHRQQEAIKGFRERSEHLRSERERISHKLEHHREIKAMRSSGVFAGIAPYRYVIYGSTLLCLAGLIAGVWGLMSAPSPFVWIQTIALGVVLIAGSLLSLRLAVDARTKHQPDPLVRNYEREEERLREDSDRLTDEWREFMHGIGLDGRISPEGVLDVVHAIDGIKADLAARDGLDRQIGEMERTMAQVKGLHDRIAPMIDASLMTSDVGANIGIIARRFQVERDRKGEKGRTEERMTRVIAQMDTLSGRMREKQEKIDARVASVGASDPEDLDRRYAIQGTRQALQRKIDEAAEIIQTTVGRGGHFERFMTSLAGVVPDAIEHDLSKTGARLEDLKGEQGAIQRSIGELNQRIEDLSTNEDLLRVQGEIETRRRQIQDYAQEWMKARIAQVMLDKAISKYEDSRQPEVIQAARGFFSRITGGAYEGIIKPVDSDGLIIRDRTGTVKGIGELSRGTREQLYCAMRLGLIEAYERRAESMPVIMDDILVNFDDTRNPLAIETLVEFAGKRQVIVLTCHRETLARYLDLGAREITLA
ncbi:MAG: ATP-binding protein [bacterium]